MDAACTAYFLSCRGETTYAVKASDAGVNFRSPKRAFPRQLIKMLNPLSRSIASTLSPSSTTIA